MSSIVADMRRSVRFIRQHAEEYGVDPNRIGVFGGSAGGQLALLLGTTGDSGNPSASDPVLRESSRVAAVVANFPATDLARWASSSRSSTLRRPKRRVLTHSLRLVPVGSVADRARRRRHGRPDGPGETMYAALTKAGVPASFIRIKGAGHGFEGADPADLERANAAMVQWFEQHLGVQPVADEPPAAARDGDAELRAAEEQREQQRQARIVELRQRFVDGPVFVMACGGSGTSNSLGAVVISGAGTV